MSNEKIYRYRNRINGNTSKRTFTAAQVARMRVNPAYKGLTFFEVKPVAVPPTLKVTKQGKDAGNNHNTGAAIETNGADPGGDNDGNSNG